MKSQHIVSSSYLAPSSPASEFIFDVCKFSDRPFIHNYNIVDVLYGSLLISEALRYTARNNCTLTYI